MNEEGISPLCLDLAAHRRALVFVATIGHRHVNPLGGERSGDYGTKATGGASDQSYAISKVHWLFLLVRVQRNHEIPYLLRCPTFAMTRTDQRA
jgi:hypothetical protein